MVRNTQKTCLHIALIDFTVMTYRSCASTPMVNTHTHTHTHTHVWPFIATTHIHTRTLSLMSRVPGRPFLFAGLPTTPSSLETPIKMFAVRISPIGPAAAIQEEITRRRRRLSHLSNTRPCTPRSPRSCSLLFLALRSRVSITSLS